MVNPSKKTEKRFWDRWQRSGAIAVMPSVATTLHAIKRTLVSVTLVEGECAKCGGPIDKEWAGESPSLGTVCRDCPRRSVRIFSPENLEFKVKRQILFNPLLGIYEYRFDWTDTEVAINGQVGKINYTQGDSSRLDICDDKRRHGMIIDHLGYNDLIELYSLSGGVIKPPELNFDPYVPSKAELLDEPILAVKVEKRDGRITGVQVGSYSINGGLMGKSPELPNLETFHAFANHYVRFKFGLAKNFCAEGGFIGDDFEIRNAGIFFGGVGLSVYSNRSIYGTNEEVRVAATIHALTSLMTKHERSRTGVIKDADLNTVIETWVNVMTTLLRYDWRRFSYIGVTDIWNCFNRMQDVLLNIMSPEELVDVLSYIKSSSSRSSGCSY